mmetsp:Transcript_41321/g.115069  ORF Transcript_41321/g.115069 Transcript_41321/m.115069 type:complete len:117 (-) Transcript_41321:450-800(-)
MRKQGAALGNAKSRFPKFRGLGQQPLLCARAPNVKRDQRRETCCPKKRSPRSIPSGLSNRRGASDPLRYQLNLTRNVADRSRQLPHLRVHALLLVIHVNAIGTLSSHEDRHGPLLH